jgi:hypothetical protein
MRPLPAEIRRRAADARRRHRVQEYRLLRRITRPLGYHLVPATFYSPIPDLDQIPPQVWTEPADMPGVNWDLDAQLTFLETELGALIAEHDPPLDPPGGETGFYLRNGNFPGLDAEVLYAMVRRFRPARVIELGAGFSTLVIAAAAARNRNQGSPVEHEVYDPWPSPVIANVSAGVQVHAIPATDVRIDYLAGLRANDILFIDTTHTLKPAGDVVHLLLGALPSLAPGVIVHLHDFYRPFEYPYALMDVFGSYWQEHYLIQGLLCCSSEFEILCANHALRRLRGERTLALLPRFDPRAEPSSLWLRKAAAVEPSGQR